MLLSDLYSHVKRALGRGAAFDSAIPQWAAAACGFIEGGIHNLPYMRKFGKVTVDLAAENPNIINFPNANVKSFRYVRYDKNGTWVYLRGGQPEDFKYSGEGTPEGYWHDGYSLIYLDKIPTEAMTFEIAWYEFSSWASDAATSHPLLVRGYNALFGQILITAGNELRDNDLIARGSKIRDEGIAVLSAVSEEMEQAGTEARMNFSNAGY